MSNWDDYRIILALERSRTLRSAAASLGLTHTTIARRLEAIQRSRGLLFEKLPNGYQPTELGQAMVSLAKQMEELNFAGTRMQQAFETQHSGRVTLSIPEPVAHHLLLDDLLTFSEQYPNIELVVDTGSSFANLDRSEADVVLRGVPNPDDHLVGRRLFPTCVTYYAHRDYLASTPADKLRWIAPVSEGYWPGWLENSPYPDAPIAIQIDDITARHRALVKGLGLGRGACFMADPVPEVVRLTKEPPVAQQDFWVLTHPDLRETPRVRAVMEFVTEAMLRKRSLVLGEQPTA